MTVDEQFKEQLGVDMEKVLSELMIPQKVYERIVKISIETTQKNLPQLNAAINQKDWSKVADITHDLIGVYANLRISSLRELVYKMRELVAQGEQACQGPLMGQLFEEFTNRFEKLKTIFI